MILTMSHWSSGLTCLLPATRVTGSDHLGDLCETGILLLALLWRENALSWRMHHLCDERRLASGDLMTKNDYIGTNAPLVGVNAYAR